MRQRRSILIVLFLLLFLVSVSLVYGETITKTIKVTYRNITIIANGKQIQSEKEPFIYEGRVFAPIRTIGEAMNKDIEWDNEKSKVLITDKLPKESQEFLSFPLHKIGERVERFPLAVTVKKVYKVTREISDGSKVDFLQIDISIENISDDPNDNVKIMQDSRPFTLWDGNGNKLRNLYGRNFSLSIGPHTKTNDNGYVWCKFDEKLKNKPLIFVFYPGVDGSANETFDVFIAFDIGKLE